MQKALLIFGGTGFVGSAAAKYALSQGIKVYCVSRSATPYKAAPWQHEIEYVKGSALDPTTYSELLPKVSAVIHSIGTLIDSKTLSFSGTYEGSYEQRNRDTALTILSQIEGLDKTFVFLSAERGISVLPRYLSTKREVEQYLSENQNKVPSTVVRPGFMYSSDKPYTTALAWGVDLVNLPDSLVKAMGLGWVAETFIPSKSLPVEIVGKVAVLSAFKEELRGRTLDVNGIKEVDRLHKGI